MNAAVILAAGESRRMGSPKALLAYRGETFLDHLISTLSRSCAPVVVVLGAAAHEIRDGVRSAAEFITNSEWPLGQTTSLQCGLRAVPADAAGVLLALVDHPAVAPDTVEALLHGRPDALVRVPRYDGRRGHPVWFSRALIGEFLALPQYAAARDVVRAHVAQTEFLEVGDPGVLADIDDPEAYRALMGAEQ